MRPIPTGYARLYSNGLWVRWLMDEARKTITPFNSANFAMSMNTAYTQDFLSVNPLPIAIRHICARYREAATSTDGWMTDPKQIAIGNIPPQSTALITDRFSMQLLEPRCIEATCV